MHVHIYVFYMDFWAISFYLLVCYVRTYTHLSTAMHVYVHKTLLVCYVHLSTAMHVYVHKTLLVCYVHLSTAMHVYVHKTLLVCYVHLSTAMHVYVHKTLLVCYVHLSTAMHVYVHKTLLVCYVHLSTAMYMYMYNIRTHSSSSSLAAVERAKRAREVERNKNLARLSLLDMEIEQDKGGAHIAPSVAWGYGPALAMPTLMGMMGGEEGAGQEEGEVGRSYVHVYLKSTSYLN